MRELERINRERHGKTRLRDRVTHVWLRFILLCAKHGEQVLECNP
jgi:hypothetical protein